MDKVKKIIAGTIIAGSMVGGVVLEDVYYKDIKVAKKMYSGSEYRQLRKEIGEKASKNNSQNIMDYSEFQLYVEVLNIEKDKCGDRRTITNIYKKKNTRNCGNVF
jgi:putative cell wall-binding protein